MISFEIVKDYQLPNTFLKLIVFGIGLAIFITILGYVGAVVYLCTIFGVMYLVRVNRLEANKRRQRAFMRTIKKRRKISMKCGRWGDFYFVKIFDVTLAADSDSPEDIKEMLFDVIRIIRNVEKEGKLPKGKLYSEQVAYYVSKLGFDAPTCRWLCEGDILSDIDFLVRMGFSREPRNMREWVDVIQSKQKSEGKVVYHVSYITRIILNIEMLAEKIQMENVRAGGFKTIA